MADLQISVPCFVVQMNNQQFITDGIIGKVENVPCRNSIVDNVLYWCSPVKDTGIFDALQFRLVDGDNTARPTFDSFLVQRVRDELSGYSWWIYVLTANDFKASCDTCCGSSAVAMPGVNGSFTPIIAPCQTICALNASSNVEVVFGIPTRPASTNYFPVGSYDNVALTTSAVGGYASTAALLTFLNTSWTNVGSPNTTFVWTISGDGLTLIATGGIAGHELCATISTIATSP